MLREMTLQGLYLMSVDICPCNKTTWHLWVPTNMIGQVELAEPKREEQNKEQRKSELCIYGGCSGSGGSWAYHKSFGSVSFLFY